MHVYIMFMAIMFVAVIIANLTSFSRPITRKKIKIVAVSNGIFGVSCSCLAYLMYKQELWFYTIGFLFFVASVAIAEKALYQKHQQLKS